MGTSVSLILHIFLLIYSGKASGLQFIGRGYNQTVSQGHEAKLNCSLLGMELPEIQWLKDGIVVQSADQMYIPVIEDHWISFLRCSIWPLLEIMACVLLTDVNR